MNEARVHILKMLQEGKITVEEAARLIETLGNAAPAGVSKLAAQAERVARPHPRADDAAAPHNGWTFHPFLACNLDNTVWDDANLEQARVWFCNLDGADLRRADLRQAWVVANNLDGAKLEAATLTGARLIACNFDHADLSGADLSGALIIGANFDHADLRGNDLRNRVIIGLSFAGRRHVAMHSTARTAPIHPVPAEE